MTIQELAILAAQDWILESDEMKAAVPSRKARLALLHPLRVGIESQLKLREHMANNDQPFCPTADK